MMLVSEPIIFVAGESQEARNWVSLLKGRGFACQFINIRDCPSIDQDQSGCIFLVLISDRDLDGILDCVRSLAYGEDRPLVVSTRSPELYLLLKKLGDKRVEVIESELPADEIVGKLRLASFNDAERRRCQVQWREITQRFENLSDKEQEVLNFLKEGFANKSIAGQIQISERAVEMRRASVMRKLKVGSHAGLIRMATLYDVYRNYGLPLPTE